ncbi:MAG: acyl-CoA dehydrogenase family protein, partial [Dehalococcoidia bacterium]
MATLSSSSDWLAQANALAPLIAQQQDAGQRERRLSQPVLDAARAAGFLRMLVPQALGGPQAALREALEVAEALGRQDASAGWNLTLAVAYPLLSDYLPASVAQAIFGQQDAVAVAHFAPRGRANRVDGGYRLSGRWTFMSGCQNANWTFAGGTVLAGEHPEQGPDGAPLALVFAFPTTAGTVIDTWHTTGMRGTGSHDYTVSDLVVPADRCFPVAALTGGPAPRPGLGYPRPFMEMGPLLLAAVGLGVARAASEAFHNLATTKTPEAMARPLAAQATVHERVGRAEAQLRAARTYLFATAEDVAGTPADAPPRVLPA